VRNIRPLTSSLFKSALIWTIACKNLAKTPCFVTKSASLVNNKTADFIDKISKMSSVIRLVQLKKEKHRQKTMPFWLSLQQLVD